jgi:hypothetical protein
MIGPHAKTQVKKYRQTAIPFEMHVHVPVMPHPAAWSDEDRPASGGVGEDMTVVTDDSKDVAILDRDHAAASIVTTTGTRNAALFDDLASGEFFSPSVLAVDRVLAVDDDQVDTATMDWKNAALPARGGEGGGVVTGIKRETETETETETGAERGREENDEGAVKSQFLHSDEGFLTVKVRGSVC